MNPLTPVRVIENQGRDLAKNSVRARRDTSSPFATGRWSVRTTPEASLEQTAAFLRPVTGITPRPFEGGEGMIMYLAELSRSTAHPAGAPIKTNLHLLQARETIALAHDNVF
jgi:hypothetical protein